MFETSKEVRELATKEQKDKAVTAVSNDVATPQQQIWAAEEATQAGSRGNAAREAFK